MDRETLNGYKQEFIHWMNKGFVYARRIGTNHKWEKLGETSKKLFRKGYEYSIENKKIFKPGDFVRTGTSVGQIITLKQGMANIQVSGSRHRKEEEYLKEWEPEDGELCIFWNDEENKATIDRFKSVNKNSKFKTIKDELFQNISPFIGINTAKI
jgi:hypothetical protein